LVQRHRLIVLHRAESSFLRTVLTNVPITVRAAHPERRCTPASSPTTASSHLGAVIDLAYNARLIDDSRSSLPRYTSVGEPSRKWYLGETAFQTLSLRNCRGRLVFSGMVLWNCIRVHGLIGRVAQAKITIGRTLKILDIGSVEVRDHHSRAYRGTPYISGVTQGDRPPSNRFGCTL
jgi:hypothetical protein